MTVFDLACTASAWQEEATTFDPNWIASSFLHTYVVVQPVEGVSAFYDEKTGVSVGRALCILCNLHL